MYTGNIPKVVISNSGGISNHMSAKLFLRFSTDIGKVPPDGPSLQSWSRLLVACPRYNYCAILIINIPKTAIISWNYVK